ncbi:MAG: thioredoxin-disulfide reductase [Christensenellales bacterium]|jgi:thioredoxin reductase (NADPH)
MQEVDLLIIGGGPAGLTAGIYACRAGLRTVLLEKMFTGGQIVSTHKLENYPGFPEGISGVDFGLALLDQAMRFGLSVIYEDVVHIDLQPALKVVRTASNIYGAPAVILALGAQPRKLGVTGEETYTGRGVSYCATCDGAFYNGRSVAVVGGGDTACEDAIYLSGIAEKVTLIHRRDTLRSTGILNERVRSIPNVELMLSTKVSEILGETGVTKLQLQHAGGRESTLSVDGVFIAVGTEPSTDILAGQVALNPQGYILTDRHMTTNIPGVFAAGDVRDTVLRQVVTAAADGAIAATEAQRFLTTH